MASTPEDPSTIPMSLRMRRVLNATRKLPPADSFQLPVKAGLMSEAEAEAAASRHSPDKKRGRKSKPARNRSTPSDMKPAKS
jgi:hypothetical protein